MQLTEKWDDEGRGTEGGVSFGENACCKVTAASVSVCVCVMCVCLPFVHVPACELVLM